MSTPHKETSPDQQDNPLYAPDAHHPSYAYKPEVKPWSALTDVAASIYNESQNGGISTQTYEQITAAIATLTSLIPESQAEFADFWQETSGDVDVLLLAVNKHLQVLKTRPTTSFQSTHQSSKPKPAFLEESRKVIEAAQEEIDTTTQLMTWEVRWRDLQIKAFGFIFDCMDNPLFKTENIEPELMRFVTTAQDLRAAMSHMRPGRFSHSQVESEISMTLGSLSRHLS